MVASSALTVPYERLKPDDKYTQPINDRPQCPDATKKLHELLKKSFLSSCLGPKQSAST